MKDKENNYHIEEDEIDLRELFQIIWDRKIFIVVFTSIITVIAIIYALIKTPIYEVSSNIQVGHIENDLVGQPEVIAKNTESYFLAMDKKENDPINQIEVGTLASISQPKALKDFITIKTEATSKEIALQRNKDVVEYIKGLSSAKIEQYKIDIESVIANKKRELLNVDEFQKKNLERQIEKLKLQKIVQIDEKITRLNTQDIKKLEKKITLLKTVDIVKIDDEIKRLENQDIKKLEKKIDILESQEIVKLKAKIKFIKEKIVPQIDSKIKFTESNLKKYKRSVNDIYKEIKNTEDTTLLTVSSLQMTNYQNLILNAQNKIEDLKLEKARLLSDEITSLEQKIKNINDVQIKELRMQIDNIKNIKISDLITKKKNINDLQIKELRMQIDNIKDISISNLSIEKQNINSDEIRKLKYKLDVELPAKKIKLEEEIQKLTFKKSSDNVINTEVVGDYIVEDSPIKPKKSLIVVVAFVTGFILSIFLVFFLNFISKKEIN